MSTISKLKQQFGRPVVIGLVSALAASAMGKSYQVSLPLLGTVPKPVFYGLLGAASSAGTEVLHQWVLPYLPQSESAVKAENAILSPVIHAGVNLAVMYVAAPAIIKADGWMEPVAIGFGAEIAGGYAWDNVLSDALTK